jgi:hypothetical protein
MADGDHGPDRPVPIGTAPSEAARRARLLDMAGAIGLATLVIGVVGFVLVQAFALTAQTARLEQQNVDILRRQDELRQQNVDILRRQDELRQQNVDVLRRLDAIDARLGRVEDQGRALLGAGAAGPRREDPAGLEEVQGRLARLEDLLQQLQRRLDAQQR